MSLVEWAKREVEIACKRENPERKEGEFDYGCACYESALKAFESLCEDGHSGMSIRFTKAILDRLIDGKPLTPIEDTDDVWREGLRLVGQNYTSYQCKRMSAFFKYVYDDGRVEYHSNDYCYFVDVNNPNSARQNGFISRIIADMFPITMPYMPGKPIRVVTEGFFVDPKNGDYDTMGILYCLKEENGEQKRIEINRFFREPEGDEPTGWTEISKEEYEKRKARKIK
jgi:hypothetical protein